jgi:hypothetical protein
MKRSVWFAVFGVLVLATTLPVNAQNDERKPVQGYFAGGYVVPAGDASDFVTDGWNLSGGAILRPFPDKPFAFRLDFGYSRVDASRGLINFANTVGLEADDGFVSMGNITAEALWEFGHPGNVGGYLGLGIGGYRRYAALTATALIDGIYCDPWWGWCYPAAVVGDVITQDDSLTKVGYSATVGMTIPAGHGQMYFEARYHYMISERATQYFPILFGYRF